MNIIGALRAAAIGVAVCANFGAPPVQAETLRVINGAPSTALNVPMNRAVVVESDRSFAELSIANSGIADISSLSERTIYVLGKEPGRTTLTLIDENGRLITNVEIHVTPDIAEFKERLRQILPGEQIEVRTANNGIVLSGIVSSTAKLDAALELANRYAPERVSNLMSVGGTQQVMLKVRFAEMQRSVSKSLSSSLSVMSPAFDSGRTVSGGTQRLVGSEARTNSQGGITPSTSAAGSVLFGFGAGGVEVGLLLEALESKGAVRTLAEPNLTALSGQEASFLAGGEYPVPTIGDSGAVAVAYRPFGVEMKFVPRVIDGDRINLELNAAVSSIDAANGITAEGIQVDAFSTRKTSTTVEMRDGESFAIAGLLKDDFRDVNGQVPWLGDIPVLGALFRSTEYQRSQTELVIIVTPHLVTPTRGEALALPGDRMTLPTERELFLNGQVLGGRAPTRGPAAEVASQDFTGSYGYVMD
ncbi:MAG: general secretion pathway protein [Rhodobacterales bacterium]|nr:MAG: general secretion pathway protein [Rhodobacterales bacterium]